jgi:acyl-CoA thioesterase FadM
MARISITPPLTYHFSTEVSVRIDDINYGGHLGNDAVLSILHEARVRMLKNHGWTELDIDGAGLIMNDAAIVYKSESFHGDNLLIQIAVADLARSGCDLLYRVTNRDTGNEVAIAKTGMVFFNYSTRRIVAVPERFKTMFQDHR